MRVAHDEVNALEPRNLLRRALGVTTRDDDPRPRIRAMNLAHRFPRLRLCRRRYRAGIQDYDIGARMLASTPFSPTTTISTQIVMDMQNAMPGTPASDALYAMSLVLLVLSSGVVLATRAISGQRVV